MNNYLLEHIYKSFVHRLSEKLWGRRVMAGVKRIRIQCIFLCSFSLRKQKITQKCNPGAALISYSTGMFPLNNTTCFYECSLCVLKHRSERPSPIHGSTVHDLGKKCNYLECFCFHLWKVGNTNTQTHGDQSA